MPFFKTTKNIFIDNDEYFESKWMDSDTLKLPPSPQWDYKRELTVEDIDLWEVIYETSQVSVYGAWAPYAEFYLVKLNLINQLPSVETFYGPKSSDKVANRLQQLGIKLPKTQFWVEEDDLWLY